MHAPLRSAAMAVLAVLATLAASPLLAQVSPEDPSVSACTAGAGYASGCDVDHDGDVDILR